MIWVAHAHDQRGEAAVQWDYVISHWAGVTAVRYPDIPPEVPLVVLAPAPGFNVKGVQSLVDFEHPDNVCYVFGSDHRHFELEMLPRQPDHLVYVPLSGYPEMFSWVACAVTLYDRAVKRG